MPLIFFGYRSGPETLSVFSFRKFSGYLSDRACHGFYSEYPGNSPATGIEMFQDFTLGYSVAHRRSEHWPFPNTPKLPHGLSFWSVQRCLSVQAKNVATDFSPKPAWCRYGFLPLNNLFFRRAPHNFLHQGTFSRQVLFSCPPKASGASYIFCT